MNKEKLSLALTAAISAVSPACDYPGAQYPNPIIEETRAELKHCLLHPDNIRQTQHKYGRAEDIENFSFRFYGKKPPENISYLSTCEETGDEIAVVCAEAGLRQGKVPEHEYACGDQKEGVICEGGAYFWLNGSLADNTKDPDISITNPVYIDLPHKYSCEKKMVPETHEEQVRHYVANVELLTYALVEEHIHDGEKEIQWYPIVPYLFQNPESLTFEPENETLLSKQTGEKSQICARVLKKFPSLTYHEALRHIQNIETRKAKLKEEEDQFKEYKHDTDLIADIVQEEKLDHLLVRRGGAVYEFKNGFFYINGKQSGYREERSFIIDLLGRGQETEDKAGERKRVLSLLKDDIEFTRQQDLRDVAEKIGAIEKEYGIKVDYQTALNDYEFKGKPVANISELLQALIKLEKGMKLYPEGLISKSGLKKLLLFSELKTAKGKNVGGYTGGSVISIVLSDILGNFHHELFHEFDLKNGGADNEKWAVQNPNGKKDYLFTSGVEAVNAGYDVQNFEGFATAYGKAGGMNEDQAEVSALLMGDLKSYILMRSKDDMVLQKKVQMVTGCELDFDTGEQETRCTRILSEDEYKQRFGFDHYEYWYSWSQDKMNADYWNTQWQKR